MRCLQLIAFVFFISASSVVLLHAHPTSFMLVSPFTIALAGSDHALHLFVGGMLPLSLAILCRLERRSLPVIVGFFMLFVLCYGLDEFIQSYTPHRKSDWGDFGMSMAGWLMAVVLWGVLYTLLRAKKAPPERGRA